MSRAAAILCLALSGCCWWGDDAPLPEPATDHGLTTAESRLDHLTDKRDSRVAAAVVVAKDTSTEAKVKSELEVAQAMLPNPTPADIAYAKERLAKGDDKFYAEQVAVSRQLAQAIVDAASRYEQEKARKQAEYAAALKEKELALAAEQEARQADKWTWAGIGLVAIGAVALFLSPFKMAAIGLALAGFAVGSFPMLSKQAWFLPSVGGVLALAVVVSVGYLIRRKPKPINLSEVYETTDKAKEPPHC